MTFIPILLRCEKIIQAPSAVVALAHSDFFQKCRKMHKNTNKDDDFNQIFFNWLILSSLAWVGVAGNRFNLQT